MKRWSTKACSSSRSSCSSRSISSRSISSISSISHRGSPSSHRRRRASRSGGFTLIELLTVLTITLVLLAIVYPGYATYVVKARRVEAQAALLELMHKQERYFTQHNTYVAFSADALEPEARRFRWWSGADAASSGYELRGEACAEQPITRCIAIKAVPGTDRVDPSFRDASCQTLTLTSTGAHSADGPDPRCWP